MPPWYATAFEILVERMPEQLAKALPEESVKKLKMQARQFINGLINNPGEADHVHKLLELVVGEQTNMWRYISVVYPNFQNLINDHNLLGKFLGVNFRF